MELNLKSERLLLRPLVESDVEWGVEMLTDREVMQYIYGDDVYTGDQVIKEMPLYTKRGGGGCIGIWAIVDCTTSQCLGDVFLLPLPIDQKDTDWNLVGGEELPDCEIEIGFILRKFAWGNGFATEAAGRLLRFAFEETQLREVVAVTDPENRASHNVLRKIGFRGEGPRRAYAQECAGFRITRSEWGERNTA
jgi:RimJ/RimL family protein N-acetyltransferase